MRFIAAKVWQAVGIYNSFRKNGHNSRNIILRGKIMVPASSTEQNIFEIVTKSLQMVSIFRLL